MITRKLQIDKTRSPTLSIPIVLIQALEWEDKDTIRITTDLNNKRLILEKVV